jgi:multisubunit Na+/H+ antiporter MnhG subunit
MGLDIRFPIGLMFALLGVLMTLFGFLGPQDIYARSLGVNVNIDWGIVMIIFGGIMLWLGRKRPSGQPSDAA